jgi:MoxR-like ATPase
MSNLFHPTAYLKKNNEDKIFNSIYGRDDIKQIILIALRAEQPVHVLLTGEPGCGKTQFLENIKDHYKAFTSGITELNAIANNIRN